MERKKKTIHQKEKVAYKTGQSNLTSKVNEEIHEIMIVMQTKLPSTL